MKNLLVISIVFLVVFNFTSCNKKGRFDVNTSEAKAVKVNRFDIDFLSLDTANLDAGINSLIKKYPQFSDIYFTEVMGVNINDSIKAREQIYNFLKDNTFKSVNVKALDTFKDISSIEGKLSRSYYRLNYHFPKLKLPELYFYVSGFNRSIILQDNMLGIGTDLYLGSDFEKYKELTYDYLITNMNYENVAADILSSILFSNFTSDISNNRLIDNMLYRGKVLYLLSVILPDELPNILIGYTKMQWEWSRKYEREIWNAIIDQKHLFSTDMMLIRKYVNDGPFTQTISQESPGRLGAWIGWQIVENYMNNNPQISIQELMLENNYSKILENSKYKP